MARSDHRRPHLPPDETEQERLSLEHAEDAWERQLALEERSVAGPSSRASAFRWIVLAIVGAGIVILLLTHLGQLT
jgi:hypothetical protein